MIRPRYLRRPKRGKPCTECEGYGTLIASWAFGRARVCDCGAIAASPGQLAEMVLHAAECDTVPCPFCGLKGLRLAADGEDLAL